MLEDSLVLLGNGNVRLKSWRQRRFAEYLTKVGKRTLKEEIPADKHRDQFHERIKCEHNQSTTSNSMISKPPERQRSATGASTFQKPFRGTHSCTANRIDESGTSTKKEAPRSPQNGTTKADYPFPNLKSINFHLNTTACRLTYSFVQNWAH